MKNKHIKNLSKVVPRKTRLEVYKSVLQELKSEPRTKWPCSDKSGHNSGLCLIIPMELWGMNDMLELSPDGRSWDYEDTTIAFPELKLLVDKIRHRYLNGESTMEVRINGLTEIITKMESKCSGTKTKK